MSNDFKQVYYIFQSRIVIAEVWVQIFGRGNIPELTEVSSQIQTCVTFFSDILKLLSSSVDSPRSFLEYFLT